jgi:hypothetical protein
MDSPIILSLHVACAAGLPTVANAKASKSYSVSRYEIIPLGARFLVVVEAASGCSRTSKLVAVALRAMEFSV